METIYIIVKNTMQGDILKSRTGYQTLEEAKVAMHKMAGTTDPNKLKNRTSNGYAIREIGFEENDTIQALVESLGNSGVDFINIISKAEPTRSETGFDYVDEMIETFGNFKYEDYDYRKNEGTGYLTIITKEVI